MVRGVRKEIVTTTRGEATFRLNDVGPRSADLRFEFVIRVAVSVISSGSATGIAGDGVIPPVDGVLVVCGAYGYREAG